MNNSKKKLFLIIISFTTIHLAFLLFLGSFLWFQYQATVTESLKPEPSGYNMYIKSKENMPIIL